MLCWGANLAPERMTPLDSAEDLIEGTTCGTFRGGVVGCEASGVTATRRDLTSLGVPRSIGSRFEEPGSNVACAVTENGELQCWGRIGHHVLDENAERGWRTMDDRADDPVPIPAPKDIVELTRRGNCGRTTTGDVFVVREMSRDGGRTFRLAAVTAKGASGAARLLAGNACVAERADGRVFALTQDLPDVIGLAPQPRPSLTELPTLRGALQLEVTSSTVCARFRDGSARCQISNRDLGAPLVLDGPYADVLAAKGATSVLFPTPSLPCALLEDGGVTCGVVTPVDPFLAGSPLPVRVSP